MLIFLKQEIGYNKAVNSIPHGANYAYNNQWTLIISEPDSKVRNEKKWIFVCGCGHESEYSCKQFVDPYAAAIIAREFHVCDPNEGMSYSDLPR